MIASLLLAVLAQDVATIHGVVTTAENGKPLAHATVRALPGPVTLTDERGAYSVEVAPGTLVVGADATAQTRTGSRNVTVNPKDNLQVDLQVEAVSRISGRVLHPDGSGVAAVNIGLVAREFQFGRLRYIVIALKKTGTRGEYSFETPTHRSFLLWAFRDGEAGTFETAQPILVQPGQQFEQMNIRLANGPTYCVQGLVAGVGENQAVPFELSPLEPNMGALGNGAGGGVSLNPRKGVTGNGGAFRLCGLSPGAYRLAVPGAGGAVYVLNRDVTGVAITQDSNASVTAEVVWRDPPQPGEMPLQISAFVRRIGADWFTGDTDRNRVEVPGEFTCAAALGSEYMMTAYTPAGVYISAVEYGGENALRRSFVASGGKARMVLARDGGTVKVAVVDDHGVPARDAHLVLLPVAAITDEAISADMTLVRLDQGGIGTSRTIAPGTYYAIATRRELNASPEDIALLLAARLHAARVDVPAGQTASVLVTLL